MTGILNLLAGAFGAVKDAYFNLTTLLLSGNGTNGAQNNTFLDSSSNNFTITRNGNTTQGTFSPFSQTGWGTYFGGGTNNDRLLVASNAGLGLSSNNFCIEVWAYMTDNTGDGPFCTSVLGTGYIANTFWFGKHSVNSGRVTVYCYNYSTSTYLLVDPNSTPVNQWVHYAFVRNGSAFTLYRNGVSVATATFAGAFNGSTSALQIGRAGDAASGTGCFAGYMSNLRVVNGSSVYTSAFTPPTSPLTAITNTGLLTLQSNRWIDNSTNAAAITVDGGTPSIQAFSPFVPSVPYDTTIVGGSGYFDASGDYITLANNTAFSLPGDFTVDGWIYLTAGGANHDFFMLGDYGSAQNGLDIFIRYNAVSSTDRVVVYSNGGDKVVGSTAIKTNTWYHIAVSRSGTGTNNVTLYVNGAQDGQYSDTTTYAGVAGNGIAIGAGYTSSTGYAINGNQYLSNIRLVKGTAVYTAAFTPPTSPTTAISGTSLLANFTNGGVIDATAKNDLETVGNAQISTTQSKFGGSSMYFDGTGDYLLAADTSTGNFGSGDFTIEFWAYDVGRSSSGTVWLSKWGNTASTGRCWVIGYVTSSTSLVFNISSDGSTQTSLISATITPALNTWNHYAVTRSGSTYRLFLNGIQQASATSTATLYSPTKPLCVGANYEDVQSGLNNFSVNGYIDDVRLTKGYARYTANFTPPSSAFPVQ